MICPAVSSILAAMCASCQGAINAEPSGLKMPVWWNVMSYLLSLLYSDGANVLQACFR